MFFRVIEPSYALKNHIFWAFPFSFFLLYILHALGLITQSNADTLLIYLGYFLLFYLGVCLGVYWCSEHYKFLKKCRAINVDVEQKSEVIRDYLNSPFKYAKYWFTNAALIILITLLNVLICFLIFYPISMIFKFGISMIILYAIIVLLIYGLLVAWFIELIKKKIKFLPHQKLDNLMNELEK